ncbi:MAG: hypothetical protein HPY50_08280 [Firmicutes bacterium]|nr:hypothetical protein [Bacillota bacterium]
MGRLTHFSFGPVELILLTLFFVPTLIAFLKNRRNKFLILGLNLLAAPIFILWPFWMPAWMVLLVLSLLKEKGEKEPGERDG